MLTVEYTDNLLKTIHKIKDNVQKENIKKQIKKIIQQPEIGKPMRFSRKGTREVYIPPFRLSYLYLNREDKIIFLDLYHKNHQ